MSYEESYEDIVNVIVEREADVMGAVATAQAAMLPFLEKSGDRVEVTGEIGKDEIDELVEKFEGLQGQGAVGVARNAVEETLDPETELELPERILPDSFR